MQEHNFFQDALADFTHEAASGGAIRHLTDMGYTVKQITKELDFPTPYEKVQKTVWQHLIYTGVILTEEPGIGRPEKKPVYVREYDKYGRTSFRRVREENENGNHTAVCWKIQQFAADCPQPAALSSLLKAKLQENGACFSYMSCGFGLSARNNSGQFQALLNVLTENQKEYVSGLPWTGGTLYHRLDSRMAEILTRLLMAGIYQGECCFLKTQDKVLIL